MFELFDPKGDVRIEQGTHLPHWFQPRVSYFVTFRTEDSIPADVSRRWHARRAAWLAKHGISIGSPAWKTQLSALPEPLRREFHETFSREYMESLDKGLGACVMRQPEISTIVADSLFHFDTVRYHLGDFVVMPNHVHLIVCLLGDTDIEAQCTSWKRFTARRINQALGSVGRFWQEESFDHLIRSAEQFAAIQRYIAQNPGSLNHDEYFLYQTVAGIFQMPSAKADPEQCDVKHESQADGTWNVPATVAGIFQMPSAKTDPQQSNVKNETVADGTRSVPATVAGIFQMPSAKADPQQSNVTKETLADGTRSVPAAVAGIFQMPSAKADPQQSNVKNETLADGTRSVPATLENLP